MLPRCLPWPTVWWQCKGTSYVTLSSFWFSTPSNLMACLRKMDMCSVVQCVWVYHFHWFDFSTQCKKKKWAYREWNSYISLTIVSLKTCLCVYLQGDVEGRDSDASMTAFCLIAMQESLTLCNRSVDVSTSPPCIVFSFPLTLLSQSCVPLNQLTVWTDVPWVCLIREVLKPFCYLFCKHGTLPL